MNTEITGTSSEIVEQVTTITSGDHTMLIYPNLYSFRDIYSQYCKTALENNEIVLLLTYYETIDNVRQTLKEIGLDTEKYEKEKALMIVQDITRTYFGSAEDFLFFIKILDKQQAKRGKNGISVFADMGVCFHREYNDKKNTVVKFERSIRIKIRYQTEKIL